MVGGSFLPLLQESVDNSLIPVRGGGGHGTAGVVRPSVCCRTYSATASQSLFRCYGEGAAAVKRTAGASHGQLGGRTSRVPSLS